MNSTNQAATIRIGHRSIGTGQPCYVIAEVGNNHNGDFDRAIALVDAAVAAGADCAKFQMRKLDEVYRASSLSGKDDDLAVEYTLDLLRRFELTTEQQRRVAAYCASKNIQYLCTPWDASSVATLETFGVQAYKVASADLTNLPLLAKLAATGKTLIVSTGMSTSDEIRAAAKFLDDRSAPYVLLHCQSTYPAALHNIHLRFMETLREIHPFVGYSGHERGIAVSIGAVAMGAILIERHITLDREMEGPDHAASLEPEEFKALVSGIREVEDRARRKACGTRAQPGRADQPREPRQEPGGRPRHCGRHGRRRERRRRQKPRPGPVAAQNARPDRPAPQPRDGKRRLLLSERPRRRRRHRAPLSFRPALGRAGPLSRHAAVSGNLPARHHRIPSQLQRHGARSGRLSVRHLRSRLRGARARTVCRQQADGPGDIRRSAAPLFAGADPGRHRHHARIEEVLSQDQASADRRQYRRLHHGRAAVCGTEGGVLPHLRRQSRGTRSRRRRIDPADHGAVPVAFRRAAPPEHLHFPGRVGRVLREA